MEKDLLYVGIFEDNLPLRVSVEQYLEIQGGYGIVFSSARVDRVLCQVYDTMPHIILLDEHLEDTSGIQAIPALKAKFPETFIVIVTGDEDPELIVKALENGASGYLNKPFSLSQMGEVFRSVREKGSFLQPEATTRLITLLSQKKASTENLYDKLTPREKETAAMLMRGMSYKEIADQLGVTFFAVNYHIKNIYLKCDVNSAGQLIFKLNQNSNAL